MHTTAGPPQSLHHDGGDAFLLQHQRRYPHRPHQLRAPQRLLWPLQEHHPHHVGAGRALHPAVYIHLSSWCTYIIVNQSIIKYFQEEVLPVRKKLYFAVGFKKQKKYSFEIVV